MVERAAGTAPYFVPLSLVFESVEDARWHKAQAAAIFRVRQQASPGAVAEALADELFCRALVEAIGTEAEIATERGRIHCMRTSVFAELRRRHPALPVHRLRKPTLVALSWAIEDECCARAQRPLLFGAFQRAVYLRASTPRWRELARVARSAMVFADFADDPAATVAVAQRPGPTRVHLPEDAPMRREWAVVCEAPDLPAVLTAWEVPGQADVPERDRVFESSWSVDPRAVRDAARVCARVAVSAGDPDAASLVEALADDPLRGALDVTATNALFNRVVAYVDRRA